MAGGRRESWTIGAKLQPRHAVIRSGERHACESRNWQIDKRTHVHGTWE
jgi:hypothetical protein